MTEAMRSTRGRLLRRWRARDNEWAQLALELGGVETGASREPVARGELEVAIAWPMGQDAEEVAEVGLGVEAMEASGWTIRAPQQRKLDAIRTLYYFVPAIDEVLSTSPDPGYVQYVAGKLRPFVAEKERLLAAAATR